MTGWILVSDISCSLKDIDEYEKRFALLGVDFKKVHIKNAVEKLKTEKPDFAIAAYFGSITNESLETTRLLQAMGIDMINSAECIETILDKAKSIDLVKSADSSILIPKTELFVPQKSTGISFPAVLKINKGSQGNGVALVKSYEQANETFFRFKALYGDKVLIQQYIPSYGKDLRFILCRGKCAVSFMRINNNDFRSNVAGGGNVVAYCPNKDETALAEKIGRIFDIKLGSVDFLFGKNGLVFCEANAMPGVKYNDYFIKNGLGDPLFDICKMLIS